MPASPDTEDARHRLLLTALRLFSQQGFAKTSTRELAEAAHVNVASISYYFGDKAGLYRAAFTDLQSRVQDDVARYSDPAMSLPEALHAYYATVIDPLREGDVMRWCMKLFFRELVEPTGLIDELVASEIQPNHDAMAALLCRHLGLAQADDGIHGLCACLAWMGVQLHMGRDINERIAPSTYIGARALDDWHRRLVHYGMALIEDERARRQADAPTPGAPA
ncbi:TetR/AcrR family transcriptional regulator [Pseudorhodoferax sp.]|uniref:TetR/AcrR family transcriptional regulator n=1 Tax=Pseudorhodoferax sp. TaxID=1993553 RepID=UPI002DD619D8|nr:CerR family C-terminal domain-containing protein [Pseudorhodoferax sp.]